MAYTYDIYLNYAFYILYGLIIYSVRMDWNIKKNYLMWVQIETEGNECCEEQTKFTICWGWTEIIL